MTTWLLGLALMAAASDDAGPAGPATDGAAIGSPVVDFAVEDDRGRARHLAEWSGRRILCVAFLRAGCPLAELDAATLAGLARRYEPRGVAFVGVCPEGEEGRADLARFAADRGLDFPFHRDRGEAAVRLGATRTPEVVVLDDRRRIRYRGRIDDRHAPGSRRAVARRDDLAEALDDLLAGRAVALAETEVAGCPIDRPARTAPEATPVPTYSRAIAPILDRSCVGCHRPGQVGPFALATYAQAAGRAGAIAEAVAAGRMPPWHADPRHGRFANDIRLSEAERGSILAWVEGGCPEGDPADLPPPIARADDWRIDRPDLVVAMPEPFQVPASGVVEYQYFAVDPGFAADRWVRAAEIRPGNRKVVHHCSVFLSPPGGGHDPATQGDLGSFCLATATPGTPPLTLPPGMAKRVPAGWRFLFVVHYAPVGTAQADRTSLGLVFADPATVRREVATNLMVDPDLRIPPHAPDHRVERTRRFDADVLLLAMFPHMHLRGKSFRYEATFPDGRTETLLDVPRFDFGWQDRYELAEPRRLPAGTTLRCVAHFDNSAANRANPDPAATVRAGPQSWDEMFNGYYEIARADEDLARPPGRVAAFRETSRRLAGPAWIAAALVAAPLLWLGRRGRGRAGIAP